MTFDPDCSMEDVVLGTTMLVENVVGTPILEMASTVMTALGLLEEPENDTTDG